MATLRIWGVNRGAADSHVLVGAAVLVACTVLASCTNSNSGDSNDDGNVVNASTRIGWDQPATDATELASLRFVIYVDGVRSELTGASCAATAGAAGFPCSSTLPTMVAGRHTLELASYVTSGAVLESDKSAPLVVTFSSSMVVGAPPLMIDTRPPATSAAAAAGSRDLATSDGARLGVDVLATVDRPSALAVAPDGALFVGDEAGNVHFVRATSGTRRGAPVVTALTGAGSGVVLDIALDPQFPKTRLVYVLDAVTSDSPHFRLSRYREVAGRLGERAVLLDAIPAAPADPAAALTFGPDGKLYLALDDGGDPEAARREASYNGKVLRLNADGTTPRDQPAATPVFAPGLASPRSVSWDPATSSLWVVDGREGRVVRLRGGTGVPLARSSYDLPVPGGPASLAVYRGGLIPVLDGNLLVAPADDGNVLVRARLDDGGNTVVSAEQWSLADVAKVRTVRVGPDGAIYIATDRDVRRLAPR